MKQPAGIIGSIKSQLAALAAMIIDVSGGANAETYPVTYCKNVDIGRFNCPVYKTDKIVLRKVPAGKTANFFRVRLSDQMEN